MRKWRPTILTARWYWREWNVLALYDDDSPSKVRGFYYRFWGVEMRGWQIGVRKVVKP